MRHIAHAISASLIALASFNAFASGPVLVDRDPLVQELKGAGQQLAALQAKVSDAAVLQELLQIRIQLRAVRQKLEAATSPQEAASREIAQAALEPVIAPKPVPEALPVPRSKLSRRAIREAELQGLIISVEKEPYEKQRLDVLRRTTAGHNFMVSQVSRLLTLLTYEHAKLALLELLAPRIVDAHEVHRLTSHFVYTASKAKLRKMFPAD